jgi:PncC family amidohydrolase
VVAYSNAAKQRLLGVPSRLLSRCGAVSEQAACSMARAVCRIAKSDFGVAVTGIAGPTGATRRKPVGTVFIAVSSREKTTCVHHRFKGTRSRVRAQAVRHALQFLLDATQQYST